MYIKLFFPKKKRFFVVWFIHKKPQTYKTTFRNDIMCANYLGEKKNARDDNIDYCKKELAFIISISLLLFNVRFHDFNRDGLYFCDKLFL